MKKVVGMMLAVLMCVALVACGDGTSALAEPDPADLAAPAPVDDSDLAAPAPVDDSDLAAPAPVDDSDLAAPAPEPVVEAEPEDPYEILAISVEEAVSKSGAYLLRNGKCYNYGERSAEFYDQHGGIGFKQPQYTELMVPLQKDVVAIDDDLPILKAEPGDELITVGWKEARAVRLTPNPGYTFIMRHGFYGGEPWKLYNADCGWSPIVEVTPNRVEQFEIIGADGRIVSPDEPYGFERGEQCTVSWLTGTKFNEYPMTADFMSFSAEASIYGGTKYEGTLTRNGYATHDLSEFEPGYWIFNQNLIVLIEPS
ncbi:hypothetical protein IJ117_00810 [Candidatus Saccharibacteria bacterium]|nr:hypothetical protein [Candidatus Saccharibacteria bacterium]